MIRIAICDDDELVCKELEHYIFEYDFKYEYDLKCDCYIECENLLNALENEIEYKLIFLDIEFPEMNGLELSNKVRNYLKNYKVQIVFISAKEQYAMKLFDMQPFNFLVKPLSKENVFSCLTKFLIYYHENNKVFEYNYENVKHRIAISEILYFESDGKKVIMHTHTKDIPFYGVFSEVADQLKHQFIVIKRGLMVNLQYIVNSNYTTIELSNNMTFTISKNNRDNVRNRLCGQ